MRNSGFASAALLAYALLAAPSPIDAQSRGARKLESKRLDLAQASPQIVASTNAFRRHENLPAVVMDAQLAKAARYFADFMARTDKYGHDADGNTSAARAKKFGYDYCTVSENIAYQFSSAGFATAELADLFFEGWQNSPGHRKNMLDPNVTETAVAIAHSATTGHYYAVQLFGRPRSASIEFSVANQAGAAVEYSVDGETLTLPARVTRTHLRCTPSEVGFRGKTLQPQKGQRLVLVNDQGGVRLQVQ